MDRRTFMIGAAAILLPNGAQARKKRQVFYDGAEIVEFVTPEQPGTMIINTDERALYYVNGDDSAIRYGVAVGRAGFDWSGIAKIGRKVEWPKWTPPSAMIRRKPELAKWRNGMPGGPENPLGSRALYLFTKSGDTGFRIHGTNEPESIGSAASSGCIRMLNEEVEELYDAVQIGTKVIVI